MNYSTILLIYMLGSVLTFVIFLKIIKDHLEEVKEDGLVAGVWGALLWPISIAFLITAFGFWYGVNKALDHVNKDKV